MEKQFRETNNEINHDIAEIPFDMPKPNFSPDTDSSFDDVDGVPVTGRFNKKKQESDSDVIRYEDEVNSSDIQDFIDTVEFPVNINSLEPINKPVLDQQIHQEQEIQTQREQVAIAEKALQAKKEGIERTELLENLQNFRPPDTLTAKRNLEVHRNKLSALLEELYKAQGNEISEEYKRAMLISIQQSANELQLSQIESKLTSDLHNTQNYLAQTEHIDSLKQECWSVLEELMKYAPRVYKGGYQQSKENWIKKIQLAGSTETIQEVLSNLRKALEECSKEKINPTALFPIDQYLNQSPEKNERPTIYVNDTKESESSAFKDLVPTDKYNIVKLSDIHSAGNANELPVDILIDGVSLRDVTKFYDSTSEKGKFISGLMLKLAGAFAGTVLNVSLYFIRKGGTLFLQNALTPKGVMAISAGIAGKKVLGWGKEKIETWKTKRAESAKLKENEEKERRKENEERMRQQLVKDSVKKPEHFYDSFLESLRRITQIGKPIPSPEPQQEFVVETGHQEPLPLNNKLTIQPKVLGSKIPIKAKFTDQDLGNNPKKAVKPTKLRQNFGKTPKPQNVGGK